MSVSLRTVMFSDSDRQRHLRTSIHAGLSWPEMIAAAVIIAVVIQRSDIDAVLFWTANVAAVLAISLLIHGLLICCHFHRYANIAVDFRISIFDIVFVLAILRLLLPHTVEHYGVIGISLICTVFIICLKCISLVTGAREP